jgi:hypothetical protein
MRIKEVNKLRPLVGVDGAPGPAEKAIDRQIDVLEFRLEERSFIEMFVSRLR